MKKIAIQCEIREEARDPNFPEDCVFIDLTQVLSGKKPTLEYIFPILIRFLKDNEIVKSEIFELYLVAPNSVCVAIPFILTVMKYKYICIPKPNDEGLVEKEETWKHQETRETRILSRAENPVDQYTKNVYVAFNGKFEITQEKTELYEELNYIVKLLPPKYNTLASESNIEDFKSKCEELFCRTLHNNLQSSIHLIPSIPAVGLMELGCLFAKMDVVNRNIYVYNYKVNSYGVGDVFSIKHIQELNKLSEEQ